MSKTLTFYFFNSLVPEMTFDTHQEELDFLDSMGFSTNPFNKIANSIDQAWEISQELSKNKQDLNYPIDGLVIKLNNNHLVEELGVVGKTPRGWCAVKFKAEEVTTKIVGVSWYVGRTGRITPVADLEPVELAGTTVKRASLHNYKDFTEKNLHPGDTLVIRKAGDIIPEVVQVLTNLQQSTSTFIAPSNCPCCHSELVFSETNVDLICKNPDCPDQVVLRLAYFAQRNIANITGLSEKLIRKFVEKFGVKDIPDLYDLPYQQIQELEGFGQKSVENLANSIEKSKLIPDYKFLAGLGLEGVGPEVAKLICAQIDQDDNT
ncbi:MAG: helix-hairpin-helix domain-containing protein [Patescibacteria group bacterium]